MNKLTLAALVVSNTIAFPCMCHAQDKPKMPLLPGTTQSSQESRAFEGRKSLTAMPALPNVPAYTGKATFITGQVIPNQQVGNAYLVIFSTRETEDQVKTWYRGALTQAGWTLGNSPATARVISAIDKDGHRCSLSINRGRTQGQGAIVTLSYTEPARH